MLQIETVRSAQQCAVTPPKWVDPLTASLPGGARPLTAIVRGPAGSSLMMVTEPLSEPKADGRNRIGTATEVPGATTSGKDATDGASNSAGVVVIAEIESGQGPALLMTSGWSAKPPRQTLPKLRTSARAVTTRPVPFRPVAATSTKGAPRSLLAMRVIAVSLTPATVGL